MDLYSLSINRGADNRQWPQRNYWYIRIDTISNNAVSDFGLRGSTLAKLYSFRVKILFKETAPVFWQLQTLFLHDKREPVEQGNVKTSMAVDTHTYIS